MAPAMIPPASTPPAAPGRSRAWRRRGMAMVDADASVTRWELATGLDRENVRCWDAADLWVQGEQSTRRRPGG